MVKVRNLKKHMERFNEVVNGLKEGKQEMAKQVQELAAAINALLAKIKVSQWPVMRAGQTFTKWCSGALDTVWAKEAHAERYMKK